MARQKKNLKLGFLFYRSILSPSLHLLSGPGMGCRFEPTCSQYAQEAVERFGILKGGQKALTRILRCHPWGGAGSDPLVR